MSKATDSGESLTIDNLKDFIDGKNQPRTGIQLVAPNMEIAKLWSKQYPGVEILVSAGNL
jgi:hypothetical protein